MVYDEWCMMSDVNVRNTEVPSKLPLNKCLTSSNKKLILELSLI